MRRLWYLFICLSPALPAAAQTLNRQNIAGILGFENGRPGSFPTGWGGGPANTISTDDRTVHSGKYSALIQRNAQSSSTFSTLTVAIPVDFAGQTIEWRGFVKTEDVSGFVALWMREDGDTPALAFNTTQGLQVNGTQGWKQYSITLPVVKGAKQLFIGFLLNGPGRAWVDDLQLLVDGKPVAEAPNRIVTVLETDAEFNSGSRISLSALSSPPRITPASVFQLFDRHLRCCNSSHTAERVPCCRWSARAAPHRI